MDKIVIIYGMPASGKTTISIVLAEKFLEMGTNVKLITGDNFANISYSCNYLESEMDLKYENMKSVLINLIPLEGIIIIDDFFKRQRDYEDIKSIIQAQKKELVTFKVNCDLHERIVRDSFRGTGKRLGTEKMLKYEEKFHEVNNSIEYDYEISTDFSGITENVNKIINKLEGSG